jgi:nitrate reductase NapE component
MTIYRMLKKGNLPAKKVGGGWRIFKEKIDEIFLAVAIFILLSVSVAGAAEGLVISWDKDGKAYTVNDPKPDLVVNIGTCDEKKDLEACFEAKQKKEEKRYEKES